MRYAIFHLYGIAALLLPAHLAAAEPFTVESAVARALAIHPALQGAYAAVAEETGAAVQAGLPPNPELEMGVENWTQSTGNEPAMEIHAGLTQQLPLSGARRMARRALTVGADAAAQAAGDVHRRIAAAAERAFYAVLAAREHAAIVNENAQYVRTLTTLSRARWEAGDIPEVDYLRAAAEQAQYTAELEAGNRALNAALGQLAAMCGMEVSALPECAGQIPLEDADLPEWETLPEQLHAAPRVRARAFREQQALLEVDAVRRAALPEPAVYLGWRRDTDADTHGLDAGIRISLPVFDRNQGARAAAMARARRVRAENNALLREELREAKALFDAICSRSEKAAHLRRHVLPQKEEVNAILERAVELGDRTLFELLAGRQDLLTLRLEILELETEARRAWIDLKALR